MSAIDFPDMQEAFFDGAGLAAFGEELDDRAQGMACSVKGAATAIAGGAPVTASATLDLLRQGTVMAAQLRYVFGDWAWTDTVLCVPEPGRFKLIRICAGKAA